MHGRIHCNLAPEIVLQAGAADGCDMRVRSRAAAVEQFGSDFICKLGGQPTSNLFSFIDPGAASASSLVSPCTAAQAPSPFD